MKDLVLASITWDVEHELDIAEFVCKDGSSVNYGYVGYEILLDDHSRKCYISFADVANQINSQFFDEVVGPEDVEDALVRWINQKEAYNY